MKMLTDLIEERIGTLAREVKYLREFIAEHAQDTHLRISYGFIFRCQLGPWAIEEYMIEDFESCGSTRIVARRDTALFLDEPLVWFPSPEHAAEVVATLRFSFPSPLAHVFMRTPLAELDTRLRERERQLNTLRLLIKPDQN